MSLTHANTYNTAFKTSHEFSPAKDFLGAAIIGTAISRVFRFSTSVSFSILVTGGLIYFMCSLIAMDPPEMITENIDVIDVVMPKDRVIKEQVDPVPPKPVDPVEPPDMPEVKQSFESVKSEQLAMLPNFTKGLQKIDSGFTSGQAMAIFKVAPEYPRRAISRGIEGFVDLMFDITPAGKTENIRVLYAEPEGYFEIVSAKTLAKWKYKPAVEDGVAMVQKNQTTRIVYELEK